MREGVVVARASNDAVTDHYGTIITVEALMADWWPGFAQHRTVSLQHNHPDLRGIAGKPMVGVVLSADWRPQLEVEIRILDPEVLKLVESGVISSASLEFLPVSSRMETRNGQDAEVYYRLSSEPELCGLSLVDIPGVPGADVLAVRTLRPSWGYAVVDPAVLRGDVVDPDAVAALQWGWHHDLPTRLPDRAGEALAALESGAFEVPPYATLSKAQIIQRGREHLARHLNVRTTPSGEGGYMNEWVKNRLKELEATGMATEEAKAKAELEWRAIPADQQRTAEHLASRQENRTIDVNINLRSEAVTPTPQPLAPTLGSRTRWLAARAAQLEAEGVVAATAQLEAEAELEEKPELGETLTDPEDQTPEERTAVAVARAVTKALANRPEDPMAAITGMVRSRRMDSDEVIGAVLSRTLLPQLRGSRPSSAQLTEAHNMLRAHGIHARALTIEGNGTVIREDLAKQFVVRPNTDVIFRNHMRSLPMGGQKKVDFPRFDAAGLGFQWNRPTNPNSLSNINETDPTLDTFAVETTELNAAHLVVDSFLEFNAQGPSFLQEILIPELRAAAQREEDRAFFLSNGVHPDPATFKGLAHAVGVTAIAPQSGNGDVFSSELLGSLLRSMPTRYRNNPSKLAFYVPVAIADDFGDMVADRQTVLGDRFLEKYANIPGPTPVGEYRSIPIYSVPILPANQTVGVSSNATTVYLVHRDIPVIGDGLTIRLEPLRMPNFITRIQIQEFVGLGYQWPDAIVKRSGVLPRGTLVSAS
jgi:hypothetical protein